MRIGDVPDKPGGVLYPVSFLRVIARLFMGIFSQSSGGPQTGHYNIICGFGIVNGLQCGSGLPDGLNRFHAGTDQKIIDLANFILEIIYMNET